MQPGDLVVHSGTGRKYTVKHTGGGDMVLVSWMSVDRYTHPLECTTSFKWDELRAPTESERSGAVTAPSLDPSQSMEGPVSGAAPDAVAEAASAPAPVPVPVPEPELETVPAAEPAHKRKR